MALDNKYNRGYTGIMKTAVSIPDRIFSRAERFAHQRKMSRSALFTVAVTEYLDQHCEEDVTEKLNQLYASEEASLDSGLVEAQVLSIAEEQW